jgi:hypothetical protein
VVELAQIRDRRRRGHERSRRTYGRALPDRSNDRDGHRHRGAFRPEGIALTDGHIWTSSAVVDRQSLEVVDDTPIGLTVAGGPDGSIWGTGDIEGSRSISFAARQFAPGDLR